MVDGVVAEDDVAEVAGFVGDEEVGEDGAVGDEAGGGAFGVGEDELVDGFVVGGFAEGFLEEGGG